MIIDKTYYDYEQLYVNASIWFSVYSQGQFSPDPGRFFYVVCHGLFWNGSRYSEYRIQRKVKEYKVRRHQMIIEC